MLGNAIALIAIAAMFGLEAYKVKDRIPRLVFGAIAVLFALGGFGISPIVEKSPAVGTFLSGIFEQPLSWFMLFIALFFVLRPLWTKPGSFSALDYAPPDQVEDIRIKIENLEVSISRNTANINGVVETVVGLQDDLTENARLTSQNEGGLVAVTHMMSEIQKDAIADFKELREADAQLGKAIDETKAQIAKEVTERVMADTNLRRSFAALSDKEWIERATSELARRASELSTPTDSGADLSSSAVWSEWSGRYDEWDNLLRDYISVSARYVSNFEEILQVEDAAYGANWEIKDSQFPNSEGVRRYKKFRIILSHWRSAQRELNRKVQQAAFEGIFFNDF